MPFEHLKKELDVLRDYYGNATLTEVSVCCAFEMMVTGGHAPTMTELAETAGASLSSVSRWLAKYEARGLVRIEPDPNDERANRIQQTPAGAEFKAKLRRDLLRVREHRDTGEREIA